MRRIAVITPVSHLEGIRKLLESKGLVYYLETGSKEEVRNLLLDFNIDTLICNPNKQNYVIDKDLLEGTEVRVINTCSTGLNHIDVKYCKACNIQILSLTKDLDLLNKLPSTSELAFGLLLDLLRNITKSNQDVFEFKNWDYTQFIGHQLKDFPVGIVGYGRLGRMMFEYCRAFGAKVFVYDPYIAASLSDSFLLNSYCSTLEELFDKCSAISLHVHVNEETKYFIDYPLISKVDYIVNTSRGELVVEEDIVRSLKEGTLKGYAADVLEGEFEPKIKSYFLEEENKHLNVLLTPHIGGMTIEGQTRAFRWAIEKL